MKLKAANVILFIEPENKKAEVPIIDDLTRKIAYALSLSDIMYVVSPQVNPINGMADVAISACFGKHKCICEAWSACHDFEIVREQLYTNSLAAHYVAYHRDEVPVEDLERVAKLPDPPADFQPTDGMLNGQFDQPQWMWGLRGMN